MSLFKANPKEIYLRQEALRKDQAETAKQKNDEGAEVEGVLPSKPSTASIHSASSGGSHSTTKSSLKSPGIINLKDVKAKAHLALLKEDNSKE